MRVVTGVDAEEQMRDSQQREQQRRRLGHLPEDRRGTSKKELRRVTDIHSETIVGSFRGLSTGSHIRNQSRVKYTANALPFSASFPPLKTLGFRGTQNAAVNHEPVLGAELQLHS